MLPVTHVEQPSFQILISSLAPSLRLRSRTFYTNMLSSHFEDRKCQLKKSLRLATYVGTTADCWTNRRKSYIAVTAHWYDAKLHRKNACLAIRRIRGTHSYDLIAKCIESIHVEYAITGKVTATTTDNGSNFVKAFEQFGSSSSTAPFDAELSDNEDDEEMVYVSLNDIFDGFEEDTSTDCCCQVVLPPHRRCACHLLNLVAKVDVKNILDKKFCSLRTSTECKLQELWNKQTSSSKNSDIIEKHLGRLFVIKNDTRWNSLYNAICRVNSFLSSQREQFAALLAELKIPAFHQSEVEYLREYAKVMAPVSDALDVLQGQDNIAISYLLPTIKILSSKLQAIVGLKHCQPLHTCILSSILTRFGHMFNDNDLMLAAICDPHFKLNWLPESDRSIAENLLKEVYNREKDGENAVVSE